MTGFCPLASGSRGNAIYLGTNHTKVLIDAGLGPQTMKKKLAEIDVHISDIDAILITHEHTDHIKGLKALALKHSIPVIANSDTAKGICDFLGECPKFKIFATGETFEFQDVEVHPFSIQHDTLDPVGYTIRSGDAKFGICTDIGFVTALVEHKLKNCDYLYVEANHEPSMVHSSPRPMMLKQRILGRTGHLSNEACGKLLAKVYHENLKHVYLAHLSGECNSPQVALKVVKDILSKSNIDLDISIATQKHISKFINYSLALT